ncbi:MAG: hypothetical protein ACRDND_11655 [Streptosporangiaceae bacterium]
MAGAQPNGQSFNYALPGDSLATFVWARPPGPPPPVRALSPSGSGQITTISLDGRPVRYVRVTLAASSGSWWSVADVRAYARARPR